MAPSSKTTWTPKQTRAMDGVQTPLNQYIKGGMCDIPKDAFLDFVTNGPYTKFHDTPSAFRQRLVDWASNKLGLDTFRSWLPKAEASVPGYFDYPPLDADDHILQEFDTLVALGIANHPPCPDSGPPFSTDHIPNDNNSLPDELLQHRLEFVGKTREEAWIFHIYERDQLIDSIQTWCRQSIAALKGGDAVSKRIRGILAVMASKIPRAKEKMNGARACIEADRAQVVLNDKNAASLPSWDFPVPDPQPASREPAVWPKFKRARVSDVMDEDSPHGSPPSDRPQRKTLRPVAPKPTNATSEDSGRTPVTPTHKTGDTSSTKSQVVPPSPQQPGHDRRSQSKGSSIGDQSYRSTGAEGNQVVKGLEGMSSYLAQTARGLLNHQLNTGQKKVTGDQSKGIPTHSSGLRQYD